jgi:hypothetical protein
MSTIASNTTCVPRVLRACAVFALVAPAVVGCSGADEPFRDCNMDSLSGTWRVSYRQTNGDCGPISDETVNISAASSGSSSSSGGGCRTLAYGISPNKCRVEQSFTCPTNDNRGTQSWTMVSQQTSPTSVSGTATVQLTHSTLGSCRSTYAMTWTRL